MEAGTGAHGAARDGQREVPEAGAHEAVHAERRAAGGPDGDPRTLYDRLVDAVERSGPTGPAPVLDRSDMQEYFCNDPAGAISAASEMYRGIACAADAGAAAGRSDWTVRVRLDPRAAAPVSEVGVAHNGRWVEARGIVAAVQKPAVRMVTAAWACAECGQIMRCNADHRPRTCSDCRSHGISLDTTHSIYEDMGSAANAGVSTQQRHFTRHPKAEQRAPSRTRRLRLQSMLDASPNVHSRRDKRDRR